MLTSAAASYAGGGRAPLVLSKLGSRRRADRPAPPRAGAPAPFLLRAGRLCETNLFRPPHGAWLAGGRALAGGGLALVTPVDPLLPALPLLEAARRQVRPRRAAVSVACEARPRCHAAGRFWGTVAWRCMRRAL